MMLCDSHIAFERPAIIMPSKEIIRPAMIPGMVFVPGGDVAGPTVLEFIGFTGNGTDGTSFTFPSVSLGSLKPGRLIIIAVTTRQSSGTGVINTVTVGGNNATNAVQLGVTSDYSGIWYYQDNTLTSANIVVTGAGATMVRGGIGVWTASNIQTTTPADTVTSTADPAALTIDVPAVGIAVAVSLTGATSTATNTWTNATERYDQAMEGGQVGVASGADYTSTTAETNRAINTNYGSASGLTACAASWT